MSLSMNLWKGFMASCAIFFRVVLVCSRRLLRVLELLRIWKVGYQHWKESYHMQSRSSLEAR